MENQKNDNLNLLEAVVQNTEMGKNTLEQILPMTNDVQFKAELLRQRLAGGLLPGADRLTAERGDLCKLCRHRAGDGASAEDADIHRSAPPYI